MSSFTGQDTISSIAAAPTFDSSNSGPPPNVAPVSFTLVSNPSSLSSVPTVFTLSNSSANGNGNPSAATSKNNSPKVSAGVVVGIAVAVFAALAIVLVLIMSMRHKRNMARRPKGTRKSWNKLDDGAGSGSGHATSPRRDGASVDMPMRAVVVEKHSTSPRVPPVAGPVPFQNIKALPEGKQPMPVIPNHPFASNAGSVSNNPHSSPTTTSPYAKHPYAANVPQTTQASSQANNIPNPFVSRSPSNSSTSQSLYNTTSADHDAYASTLSAFPAVQMALRLNSVASSTEYSEDRSPSPTQSHHPVISNAYLDVEHQHTDRKSYESFYEHYSSRDPNPTPMHKSAAVPSSTDRNAIQDLITALDGEKQPPTAWKDGNINRGSSRLSLGEDFVDPTMPIEPQRHYAGYAPGRSEQGSQVERFPSPRANGNNSTSNPFRDQF